ncbi:MAG: Uncharacterized protein AWU57_287 [Marinobacter sp. T13-3]|nr:MAG: Uncharacterized protein AWU57_287 [Marinobacter sp. T13-3]
MEHDITPPASQAEANAMIKAALAWYRERDLLNELPDEVIDLPVGDMVSVDVSTGEHNEDHRVFGVIDEWQVPGPDGGRVWLCHLDCTNYTPALSTDYERLYDLICEGHRVAGWADSYTMQDANGNPLRDVCEIRRRQAYEITIGCRGTSYGNIFPFMKEEGSEKDLFIRACQRCNLAWANAVADTPTPSEDGA